MRARIVFYLAWVAMVASLFLVGSPTPAPAKAIGLLEATSTATPAVPPPVLLEPADGVVLPQPVSPQTWTFRWEALRSACKCSIAVWEPNGPIYLGEQNIAPPRAYTYIYTTSSPLPRESLGPWYWKVWITCPNGSNESETRTFNVEPAPTPTVRTYTFLPLLLKAAP
jgi:hypothetical protein